MIRPLRNRVMVRLLPRYGDMEAKLNLVLVDGKKHYQDVRRGVVEAAAEGVRSVKAGDTVIFYGDRGTSFGMDDNGVNDGTECRSLSVRDILAVEETIPKEEACLCL